MEYITERSQILNMDESAIYLDAPSNYTYAESGARRVKAVTSGNDRTRLSVAFTAAADGTKLPLLAIIPRKTPLQGLSDLDIVCEYKSSSTFDDEMILKYIQRIVLPYKLNKGLNKVVLLLDSATCHQTKKVSDFCLENNVFLLFIPPRLTNLLQPADVVWFAPIKKAYKKKWNHWFIYDEHTFTINNNMRSPGYLKALKWLTEIWAELDSTMIAKSFDSCGIRTTEICNDTLMLDLTDFHSILAHILRTNQVYDCFITDDLELDDAENQMNEDDAAIFDEIIDDISEESSDESISNSQLVLQPTADPEKLRMPFPITSQREIAEKRVVPFQSTLIQLAKRSRPSISDQIPSTSASTEVTSSASTSSSSNASSSASSSSAASSSNASSSASSSSAASSTSKSSSSITTTQNSVAETQPTTSSGRGRKKGSFGKKKRRLLGLPSPEKKTKKKINPEPEE